MQGTFNLGMKNLTPHIPAIWNDNFQKSTTSFCAVCKLLLIESWWIKIVSYWVTQQTTPKWSAYSLMLLIYPFPSIPTDTAVLLSVWTLQRCLRLDSLTSVCLYSCLVQYSYCVLGTRSWSWAAQYICCSASINMVFPGTVYSQVTIPACGILSLSRNIIVSV